MADDFATFHASIVRFCSDLASRLNAEGMANMVVVNFDAHADVTSLPAHDVIGPHQFSLEEDNGNHTVTVAIGVSTYEDLNLFRMYQVLSRLWPMLKPGSFIQLYDAETAANRGLMKIMNGTTLLPIGHEQGRVFHFIQFSAGTAEIPRP